MALIAQKIDLFLALGHSDSAIFQAEGVFSGIYTSKVATNLNESTQMTLDRTDDKTSTAGEFYRDMFAQQIMKADMLTVSTEYAWDINWCDPCAADPLSHEELLSLGAFWLTETPPDLDPGRGSRPIMPPMGGARDAFVAPINAPYDAQRLAEVAGRKFADIRQQTNLRTADSGNDGKCRQKFCTC